MVSQSKNNIDKNARIRTFLNSYLVFLIIKETSFPLEVITNIHFIGIFVKEFFKGFCPGRQEPFDYGD